MKHIFFTDVYIDGVLDVDVIINPDTGERYSLKEFMEVVQKLYNACH